MSILLKEYPQVPMAGKEIEINELSIAGLRSAKRDVISLVKDFFKKLEEVQKMDTDDEKTLDVLDNFFDFALDYPYEICRIFVPEITKDMVENAKPREILNLISTAIEVNGFLLMKEKLQGIIPMMR